MASGLKSAELIAEIKELQSFQMESRREAVFGGWTRAAEEAYQRRADRLHRLVKELEALDGLS
jgi:uncharacterized protein YukE